MAEKRKCTLHLIGGLAGGFVLGWIIKNLVHPPIEDEIPEPGLIVISPKKTYTRGFGGHHNLNFKSTVDSVTQVKLMLEDPKGIFDQFMICYKMIKTLPYWSYDYETVLNMFQANHLWQTDNNYNFPAMTTKTIKCSTIRVKPDAPIGVHALTWRVTYMTYTLGGLAQEEVRVPWKVMVYPIEEAVWKATITEALRASILLYPELI